MLTRSSKSKTPEPKASAPVVEAEAEKSPVPDGEPENKDEYESEDDQPKSPNSEKRSGTGSPPRKRRKSGSASGSASGSESRSPSPVRRSVKSLVQEVKKNVVRTSPEPEKEAKPKKEQLDTLRSRTGGAYIPPAKLRLMQEQMTDKSGEQYQRMNWERMKKKLHGLVNRVNVANIVQIVREILQENVIRGKGLLTRSIIQAQSFSPGFSNVYAAVVAVINSKFPHVGELLLRRLIVQFKRSFRRNDRGVTVTIVKFIAHLINQQVAHEVLALEIMLLMLEKPTDDSVEVTIAFLKECGHKLQDTAPAALTSVFDRLRAILMDSDNNVDMRVRYMIEVALQIRKEKFKAYPAVIEDLDLIEEDDQITHTLSLEDATDPENVLNVFKMDEEFEKNEQAYNEIREEIIGDADISSDEDGDDDDDDDDDEDGEDKQKKPAAATTEIIDNTEQNLIAFRREVYLTMQSSLDFQEAAHKLLKMKIKPELEPELCNMLVDCCAQQRTYERFYGMLVERFCRLRLEYQQIFEQICRDAYSTVHRFEITKLRNLARLVSHLLYTDAIDWKILSDVKMTEEDTTSSGRIYIKYIFQELVEAMGIVKLYERVKDPTLAHCFAGLFPRDNPQNARFSINFFTMIGLGGLTLELREWLEKGMKKQKDMLNALNESDSDSSSSDSSDSDSSDSSDSSSSDSSDSSESSVEVKKKKKKSSKKVVVEKENKSRSSGRDDKRMEKGRGAEKHREERVVEKSPKREEPDDGYEKNRRRNRRSDSREKEDRRRRDDDDRGDRRDRNDRNDRKRRDDDRRDDRKDDRRRDDREDRRRREEVDDRDDSRRRSRR